MARVFIGVGSNIGNRLGYLNQAIEEIGHDGEIRFLRRSKIRETDPVGGPPQGKYLNAVWEIETDLTLEVLHARLRDIEDRFGRERKERNAPRTLDLDILFYDQLTIESDRLTVPHPRLHERSFVLEPLAELDPGWIHPKLNRTVAELWEEFRERNQGS
jgi:2-amino-4-hydroxy-6-hydroxymethyldihydropteridine diphosphokinase